VGGLQVDDGAVRVDDGADALVARRVPGVLPHLERCEFHVAPLSAVRECTRRAPEARAVAPRLGHGHGADVDRARVEPVDGDGGGEEEADELAVGPVACRALGGRTIARS